MYKSLQKIINFDKISIKNFYFKIIYELILVINNFNFFLTKMYIIKKSLKNFAIEIFTIKFFLQFIEIIKKFNEKEISAKLEYEP